MILTTARVAAVCAILESAGADWAPAARRLPEFDRLSVGKPTGPGLHRPWVLLSGEHERYDTPVRLLLHENGRWFLKGTYLHEVERTT